MLMQIFLLGRHTAPNVPLGLVEIQHLSDFLSQPRIKLLQTLRDILVDCALRHSKILRGLPYGRAMLDDVICDTDGPLLNIIPHLSPLMISLYSV